MFVPGNNFEEEQFATKEERDKRWEELMLVKPHVYRASTVSGENGKYLTKWLVLYPRYVEEQKLYRGEEMGRSDARVEEFEKAGVAEAASE